MKVSQLMHKPVLTAGADEDAEQVWRRMKQKKVRHLVVLRDGRVAGVVSDRDMCGERGPGIREGRLVRQMMTPGVLAASPDMTVNEAAGLLREHGVSCLPVVAEDGKLRGILTTTDILDYVISGGKGGAPARAKRGLGARVAGTVPTMPRI
jgi:CBS domain-containing protein